jgi:hypothetical protein
VGRQGCTVGWQLAAGSWQLRCHTMLRLCGGSLSPSPRRTSPARAHCQPVTTEPRSLELPNWKARQITGCRRGPVVVRQHPIQPLGVLGTQ